MNRSFFAMALLGLAMAVCAMTGCSINMQTGASGSLTHSRGASGNLDRAVADLAAQIATSLSERNMDKIAVMEFSDLEGEVTPLGTYLAEELVTRLVLTGTFEVVDRQLVNEVVSDNEIDAYSARELRDSYGIHAVVTGTVADLGSVLKVNARVISTESGSVFAVASAEIVKDDAVTGLIAQRGSTLNYTSSSSQKTVSKVQQTPEERTPRAATEKEEKTPQIWVSADTKPSPAKVEVKEEKTPQVAVEEKTPQVVPEEKKIPQVAVEAEKKPQTVPAAEEKKLAAVGVEKSVKLLKTKKENQKKLGRMETDITKLIADKSCSDGRQCRFIAFGAKPCGGPWKYLVYSVAKTDSAALAGRVAEYNAYEKAMNLKYAIKSDCSVPSKPTLGCRNGQCVDIRGSLKTIQGK